MTFAQRRNRLTTTHFSERIPVFKRRISVFKDTVSDVTTNTARSKERVLGFHLDFASFGVCVTSLPHGAGDPGSSVDRANWLSTWMSSVNKTRSSEQEDESGIKSKRSPPAN